SDVMLRGVPVAVASTSVRQALSGPLAGYGSEREWLLISDGGRFAGIAARAAMQNMPETQWDASPVGAVAVPAERLQAVAPEESLSEVLQRMDADGVPVLMVVRDGEVE